MNRRAPLFAAAGALVLVLAAFFLLVFPKMREVSRTEEELEQARSEEVGLRSELARLQAVREDAPRVQRQLARLRRNLPPVADLPGLINQLQSAADVSGVDFFSITPGTPVPVPAGASEIPAQVQVIGGFFPVDEFLFRLETLPRASKVLNISVAEGTDGLPQISVTLDVRFFTTDLQAGPGGAPPAAPEDAPEDETGDEADETDETGDQTPEPTPGE